MGHQGRADGRAGILVGVVDNGTGEHRRHVVVVHQGDGGGEETRGATGEIIDAVRDDANEYDYGQQSSGYQVITETKNLSKKTDTHDSGGGGTPEDAHGLTVTAS